MWAGQGQKRADACDVVVVGAGLVGAAVAARLTRERFDTAVLEAQSVAGSATGRSAGMVLTGLAGHYNWAVSAYGRQRARDVWALTVEGRERLVETAKRLGVDVGKTGSLALAVEDAEAEALEESAALLQEDGFDVRFNPDDPLDRGFRVALHQPDDVTVDAAALTQALLTANNVTVHEGTEVYDLEPKKDGLRVWARGRTVRCNAVVLAINGYAPLLDSYFADKIAPSRSLIFATEPLDAMVLKQPCCADYGYEYCRQLPDRRLLLGGWRRPHSSGQEEKQAAELGDVVQDGLTRFASRHFPEIETHDADRWSGTMGFTPDGLPLLGSLPDLPQVYFAVGLGGRGLAWAFVVAGRLVELMLHDADPGILSAVRLT
ncbi:MAG: NAD(P)/FAD-dependent oxidoreductase [Anaerolineae bacterium]